MRTIARTVTASPEPPHRDEAFPLAGEGARAPGCRRGRRRSRRDGYFVANHRIVMRPRNGFLLTESI